MWLLVVKTMGQNIVLVLKPLQNLSRGKFSPLSLWLKRWLQCVAMSVTWNLWTDCDGQPCRLHGILFQGRPTNTNSPGKRQSHLGTFTFGTTPSILKTNKKSGSGRCQCSNISRTASVKVKLRRQPNSYCLEDTTLKLS